MKESIKKGFSFGFTSGIITTLGLIVGLDSSTHSTMVVIGGILVIAVADAMSDALGIHISEEAENHHTPKQIWCSTGFTFASKFVFAVQFVVPFLLYPQDLAINISIIWGLVLIAVFSYYLARVQKIKPVNVIFEHLVITVIVIIATHMIGSWAATLY